VGTAAHTVFRTRVTGNQSVGSTSCAVHERFDLSIIPIDDLITIIEKVASGFVA